MEKKVILVILFLLASLIGTGLVYGYNTLSQFNEMLDTPKLNADDLKINYDLDIDMVNVAIFGVDGRSDVDGDRSDTIMIASLDFRNKVVKVTSVMRDLLVQIPSTKDTYETMDKINAAYAFGGPELTIKTLNENFDLNIIDYVVVNFDAMVDTVDAIGGVEIDIKSEDILEWTNKYIDDVNDKVKKRDSKLESIGSQTLTGVQALAYARNRFSDDDYGRTERQREVVGEIAKKAFDIDIITGVNLLNKIYPYIKTTLSLKEIVTYAQVFMNHDDATEKAFLDYRVPVDNYNYLDTINSVSYVIPNTLSDNVVALHKFIYGPTTIENTDGTTDTVNNNYTTYRPTTQLKKISDAIAYYAGTSPKTDTNKAPDPEETDNSYTNDSTTSPEVKERTTTRTPSYLNNSPSEEETDSEKSTEPTEPIEPIEPRKPSASTEEKLDSGSEFNANETIKPDSSENIEEPSIPDIDNSGNTGDSSNFDNGDYTGSDESSSDFDTDSENISGDTDNRNSDSNIIVE